MTKKIKGNNYSNNFYAMMIRRKSRLMLRKNFSIRASGTLKIF